MPAQETVRGRASRRARTTAAYKTFGTKLVKSSDRVDHFSLCLLSYPFEQHRSRMTIHVTDTLFHLRNDSLSYIMQILPNGYLGQLYGTANVNMPVL